MFIWIGTLRAHAVGALGLRVKMARLESSARDVRLLSRQTRLILPKLNGALKRLSEIHARVGVILDAERRGVGVQLQSNYLQVDALAVSGQTDFNTPYNQCISSVALRISQI